VTRLVISMDEHQLKLLSGPDWQRAEHPEEAHLWMACRTGNYEQVCELIGSMIDASIPVRMEKLNFMWGAGESKSTPLFIAALEGYVKIVSLLILAGADMNAKGTTGCCPLHIASRTGHIGVVRALLEGRANVNSLSQYRTTPLHEAAKSGQSQVALLLIERGADVWAQDKLTLSPLHYAIKNQHKNTVDVLLANLRPAVDSCRQP
jgi:hypothetical protein